MNSLLASLLLAVHAAEGPTLQLILQSAQRAVSHEEFAQAQSYYESALEKPVPLAEKRTVLLDLAALLEEKLKQPARAATVYEQFVSLFPSDLEVPAITLRLGRIYRELGAFKSAINRLFGVLNSAMRLGDTDAYRRLVQDAQFEIAETYFAAGQYAEAATYFERLTRLDLPAEQKVAAEFKSTNLKFLRADHPAALAAAQLFLKQHADHPLAAEAQYIAIQSLRRLGRTEEALQEALKILRAAKAVDASQPAVWKYWRLKMGNDLANDLYAKNSILPALTVYQVLAELEEAPEWRWPAVYQIGLCFERLQQPARAAQAYQYLQKQTAANASELTNLGTIKEMAAWRASQLQWREKTTTELAALVLPTSASAAPSPAPEVLPAAPPPTEESRETAATAPAAEANLAPPPATTSPSPEFRKSPALRPAEPLPAPSPPATETAPPSLPKTISPLPEAPAAVPQLAPAPAPAPAARH